MGQKIVFSCDSTCDLSEELVAKYDIRVFPLFIVKDGQSLKDGIDIRPDDIYAYKEQTGRVVSTTAPNLSDYTALFDSCLKDADAVVHFNISAEMSSAHNNAKLAAAEYDNVFVVDTRNLSTGSGLLVLRACDMRAAGRSAKEIYEELQRTAAKVDASFILDTLEYLYKGGRCSAVAALGANLLRLKPCIEVKQGKMGVGKKYRGNLLAVHRQYVADRLSDADDIETDRIFITHSGASQELIEQVRTQVQEALPFREVLVTRAGCTISTHCGPNTLGILFIRRTPLN